MVRWMRSARVAGGKFPQAVAWSKEMAKFAEKYQGVSSVNVFLDVFGESGTIRWVVDYQDLATLENVQNQILTDQEYWKKIGQAQDFFVDGTIHDMVMRSL